MMNLTNPQILPQTKQMIGAVTNATAITQLQKQRDF